MIRTNNYAIYGGIGLDKAVINMHSGAGAHRREMSLADYQLFLGLLESAQTKKGKDAAIVTYLGEDLGECECQRQ